ncbi:T9SS type A sorting domain-containing protein [Flavitalea flava]
MTIYPGNAGNSQTMTLTAFKAGTMVTGSTITINYVAPAHETALTSTNFGSNYDNIDEIRATTTLPQGFDLTNITTTAPSLPLPVHLISFTGQNTASGQVLHWKVENEVSFSHYTIEEGVDGASYTDMGKVPATGKSDYTFTSTYMGLHNYYRLKLVDIDGFFSFSKVLMLEGILARQEMLVYPNPAVSQININSPARLLSISVSSTSGMELIRQIPPDGHQATLFIGALPPGIYLIGVRTTEGLTVRKVSKL